MTLPGVQLQPVKPRSVTVTLPRLALLVLASMLVGVAATWAVTHDRGVPRAVRGTVTAVNFDETAIGFSPDDPEGSGIRKGESMILSGALYWRDRAGSLHGNGVPPCLQHGSHGQRVELGVVQLHRGSGSHPAPTMIVVWARCLSS